MMNEQYKKNGMNEDVGKWDLANFRILLKKEAVGTVC